MIMSLSGSMGSGKTTCAFAFGYEQVKVTKQKFVSNHHSSIPNSMYLTLEWFLDNMRDTGLDDTMLVLDEMYQMADSRSSASKVNKLFSYFIVQTRKRRTDVIFCTHYLTNVEKRLRQNVDMRGDCSGQESICKACKGTGVKTLRGITARAAGANSTIEGAIEDESQFCDKCLGYGKIGLFTVTFHDRRRGGKLSRKMVIGNNYWHLFDTEERLAIKGSDFTGINTAEVV